MSALTREAVLERMAQVIHASGEGSLLVLGPPGSGKSRLLRIAAEQATRDTVIVRANAGESGWPLSGFSALFASIDDSRAVEFAGRFALRSTDAAAVRAAAGELLALLRGLRLSPVAVLVDDIDAMDPESRVLFGFMAPRLAASGVRIVATATEIEPEGPLAGFPSCRLGPVDDDEALRIAASVAEEADAAVLRIVVRHSSGNAGALVHSLRSLTPGQADGSEPLNLPFGPSPAAQAIADRTLAGLTDEHARLLRYLAVAPLASQAAIVTADVEAAEALDDLVQESLVDETRRYVRLTSPLIRSALYRSTPGRQRRELHERLAAAHRDHDEALETWHESFLTLDEGIAERLLRHASTLARAGLHDAAVELGERSLRGRFSSASIGSGLLELASSFCAHGEMTLAGRYVEHAEAIRSGSAAGGLNAAVVRLWIDYASAHRVPAADIDTPVDLHAGEDPGGAVRLLSLAGFLHVLHGEPAAARALLARAEPSLGLASSPDALLHDAVMELAGVIGGVRRTGSSHGAPGLPTSGADAPGLVARARALSLRDEHAAARRLFALVSEELPDADPVWRGLAGLLAVDDDIRAGKVGDALVRFGRLRHLALPQVRWPQRQLVRAWSDAAQGALSEARERLSAWLRSGDAVGTFAIARAFVLDGEIALWANDPDAAAAALTDADAIGTSFPDPSLLRHLPLLVEALVAVGRPADARRVFERLDEAAARFGGRWSELAVARSRPLVAPGDETVELLDDAIAQHGPDDSPFDRAMLLARRAKRLRELGDPSAETAELEARIAFDEIGAEAWSRRLGARGPAPRASQRPDLISTLSDGEREVARLVQLGFHNKEIAARLYVSVRTVELRLTHIYRKTGARSRSHLATVLPG